MNCKSLFHSSEFEVYKYINAWCKDDLQLIFSDAAIDSGGMELDSCLGGSSSQMSYFKTDDKAHCSIACLHLYPTGSQSYIDRKSQADRYGHHIIATSVRLKISIWMRLESNAATCSEVFSLSHLLHMLPHFLYEFYAWLVFLCFILVCSTILS